MPTPDLSGSLNEIHIEPGVERVRADALEEAFQVIALDLAEDHFASALGNFRQALCLSQGLPGLQALIRVQAVQFAEMLLPRNWRVAETLLRETASFDSSFSVESDILEKLTSARIEEAVTGAIHQADKAEFNGNTDQARKRLLELIAAYPGETRLTDRLVALDTPRQVIKRDAAGAAQASKGGAQSLRKLALQNFNFDAAGAGFAAGPGQEIPWRNIKGFAAIAAATAMLGVAGFVVWHHFAALSQPVRISHVASPSDLNLRQPPPPAPVIAAQPIPPAFSQPDFGPEEQAWNLVKTSDSAPSLRAFLSAYPASTHALRAKVRLAAMEWAKVDQTDTGALEAYLHAHPRGFYMRQAQRLILQLNAQKLAANEGPSSASLLDRAAIIQAVRDYQKSDLETPGAPSTRLLVQEPVIEGENATVRCLPDGTSQNTVNLSLQKVDGVWKVLSVR